MKNISFTQKKVKRYVFPAANATAVPTHSLRRIRTSFSYGTPLLVEIHTYYVARFARANNGELGFDST